MATVATTASKVKLNGGGKPHAKAAKAAAKATSKTRYSAELKRSAVSRYLRGDSMDTITNELGPTAASIYAWSKDPRFQPSTKVEPAAKIRKASSARTPASSPAAATRSVGTDAIVYLTSARAALANQSAADVDPHARLLDELLDALLLLALRSLESGAMKDALDQLRKLEATIKREVRRMEDPHLLPVLALRALERQQ